MEFYDIVNILGLVKVCLVMVQNVEFDLNNASLVLARVSDSFNASYVI